MRSYLPKLSDALRWTSVFGLRGFWCAFLILLALCATPLISYVAQAEAPVTKVGGTSDDTRIPLQRPVPIDITTVDGQALSGEIVATARDTFYIHAANGEQTVSWRCVAPRDIYDIHVKMFNGGSANSWRELSSLLRTVAGGRELAVTSLQAADKLNAAANRPDQAADTARLERLNQTLKVLERKAGSRASLLRVNPITERIWYDAPKQYEDNATNQRKLAGLLADHLVTADALLNYHDIHKRRLGLGLACMVVDGTARHLEMPAVAVAITETLLLPNLSVTQEDPSLEFNTHFVIATALYAYREAEQPLDSIKMYRQLLDHAPNPNAAAAARFLLAQHLAREGDLTSAIVNMRNVQGRGVRPGNIDLFLSQYRRDLIGPNFHLSAGPTTQAANQTTATELPLDEIRKDLTHAQTRQDIWYIAAQAQATVTHPCHSQIGITKDQSPAYHTFSGDWTPDSDCHELWMFSDDGSSVEIKYPEGDANKYSEGAAYVMEHDRKNEGQHIASWRDGDWIQSLYKVPNRHPFKKGKTYRIRVKYRNLSYYTYFADIDGCTLFVIEPQHKLELVVAPNTVPINSSTTFTAKAINADGTPGAGKKVQFRVDGALEKTETTSPTGVATYSYTPSSSGTLTISATADGYYSVNSAMLVVTP